MCGFKIIFFSAALATVFAGCAGRPHTVQAAKKIPAAPLAQMFFARGVVKELKPDGKTVVIAHEEIPGYMGAMTMPFVARTPSELAGLQAGDTVSFQLIVGETDGWIEKIVRVERAQPVPPKLPPTLHVVKDVAPLNVGDALPDYTFTNALGRAVSLAQFRGQTLAITFIFTSCPFPTFCPQMSRNFAEAQVKLKRARAGRWHLLTLSFDPANDTPAVLKSYAEVFHADPARWDFLTGDLAEISAFTEQFGLQFWRLNPGEPLTHNLRTVVVDAAGRVRKILPNNDWTSDELVAEMLKAAAK